MKCLRKEFLFSISFVPAIRLCFMLAKEKRTVNPFWRKIIERTNRPKTETKMKPSLFTHWIWKFHYFSGVVVTTAAEHTQKRNVIRIEQ